MTRRERFAIRSRFRRKVVFAPAQYPWLAGVQTYFIDLPYNTTDVLFARAASNRTWEELPAKLPKATYWGGDEN